MLGADGVVLPQEIYAFGPAGIDLPLAPAPSWCGCLKDWETAGTASWMLPTGKMMGVEATPLAQDNNHI